MTNVTNLHMVRLKVLAPNAGAVRAYEKAGFQRVGAIRQAGYWLGQACDAIVMDAPAVKFAGPSLLIPTVGTSH
ncbi:GNAT family N-acetyltransferase [Streptomyces sp. NPDC059142]|uniref:GNAT family N-acetyltransferase n=1 Tax=Streptomyces sp. NPDC059142 TaxID=3346739 RepID=UPI0036C53BFB